MKRRTIAILYTWGSGALTMMGLDYWIDSRYVVGPLCLLAAVALLIAAMRLHKQKYSWPVNLESGMLTAKGIVTKSHKEMIDGQEATVVDELKLTGVSFVEKGGNDGNE